MKRFGKVLVAMAAVVALVGIGQAASADHEEGGRAAECPDHQGHPNKVEGQGTFTTTVDGVEVTVIVSGPNVSFEDSDGNPIVVEFCIKASAHASGVQTGSSGTVDWNAGANEQGAFGPNISYVVVYDIVDDDNDVPDDDDEEEEEEEEEEVKEVEPEPAVAVVVEPVLTG